jgi:hypothetical protein
MIIDTDALIQAIAEYEESKDLEKMTMRQLTASETIQLKRQEAVRDVVSLLSINGIFKHYEKIINKK